VLEWEREMGQERVMGLEMVRGKEPVRVWAPEQEMVLELVRVPGLERHRLQSS
jgi:hypothetical protein